MEEFEKVEVRKKIKNEREGILQQLEDWLETPMLDVESDLARVCSSSRFMDLNPFLEAVGFVIWGVFILEFALKFFLAPKKIEYLKNNWLIAYFARSSGVAYFSNFPRVPYFSGDARGSRSAARAAARFFEIGMNALGESFRRRGFK